ncbi:MAG: type II toxin-antitoxin system VapC family toxin [Intrasporangium sp.]|uniref:type II toxin-antitoxin system tRNA(fMet)-specific endonuclease VapC n=1 Tax=Intrasporangium sp. TaxID=1925024 RepID=UPI0026494985|nr:type II toxin-antitoxin system VapC family toxin [Intrasporangium sp.]MDN5796971.1 type II toxin-antitoxin system VapC family toxin [Intrasporangium sp.]
MRFLLDTNVVINVLRGTGDTLRERMRRHADELAVSTITVAELHFGVGRSSDPVHNRRAVAEFLAFLDVLPFDAAAAEHAGDIRAVLTNNGTPIGAYDVLIGGHARSRAMTVVTNNRREFDRVPGLLVTDWTTSGEPAT